MSNLSSSGSLTSTMDPRGRLIEYLFGDMFKFLWREYKISPGVIPCIFICLIIYFNVLRKHKKGAKYTLKEKFDIGIMIWAILLTIIMQIVGTVRNFKF